MHVFIVANHVSYHPSANHTFDLHWDFKDLEEMVIQVLFSAFYIETSQLEDLSGVWFAVRKTVADYAFATIAKFLAVGYTTEQVNNYRGLHAAESLASGQGSQSDGIF